MEKVFSLTITTKWTIKIHDMDKSQKEHDTEHILGGSICMKLPNRQN